jgi:hypothetical protein
MRQKNRVFTVLPGQPAARCKNSVDTAAQEHCGDGCHDMHGINTESSTTTAAHTNHPALLLPRHSRTAQSFTALSNNGEAPPPKSTAAARSTRKSTWSQRRTQSALTVVCQRPHAPLHTGSKSSAPPTHLQHVVEPLPCPSDCAAESLSTRPRSSTAAPPPSAPPAW